VSGGPYHGDRLTVTEAHQRFGDLARIRNGVTTWLEVQADGGVWKPIFVGAFMLAGWEFQGAGR
jgi:hypothetical protein